MSCVMTHRCLPTILRGLFHCHFPRLLHKMWLPQRGCWCRLIYLYSLPNYQPPCGTFFKVVTLSVELGFSNILVLPPFIVMYQQIWLSVTIIATLVALALENLVVLLLFVSLSYNDRTYSYGSGFSCVWFMFNSIFQE